MESLLRPGSGRHRPHHLRLASAALGTEQPEPAPRPAHGPRRHVPEQPRRPHTAFLDGDAVPLVRPYLVAHEQRERRAQWAALAPDLTGDEAVAGPYVLRRAVGTT
ncbi:hypothetical protein ACWGJ2_33950 [Streptomyces sp. NPDC054796]